MGLDPSVRRAAFTSLAVVALLTLVVTAVVVLLPAKGVQWWLIGCLAALVLVIAAEIVLVVLDRRPDEEVYDFIIEDEGEGQAR